MKKEMLIEKQIEKDNKFLITGLDLGICGSNVEKLATIINIPYLYLSSQQRIDLAYIIKNYIRPNLRDKLRQQKEANILGKEITSFRRELSPDKLSTADFWAMIKEADVSKINLHYQIANFLGTALFSSKDEGQEFFKKAQELYLKTKDIEPRQIALSSKIKDFIEYYVDNKLSKFSLNPEEILLLTTPSLIPFSVKFGVDVLKYRLSLSNPQKQKEKERLLKLYFNNDENQFVSFKKENSIFTPIPVEDRRRVEEYIKETEEHYKNFRVKKLYFLLERQIRYAREIDNLLILDNCLDGYNISKEWFHHDLFLKIYLISKIEHCDFSNLVTHIRDRAKELVFYPEEKLLLHKI